MSLDFPLWLRATHILNILFLSLLARSGLEILSAHPKLYWNNDCLPGSQWLAFTNKQMPLDRLWTSRDEEVAFSSIIALPGQRHLGLGRHWHFASVIAWLLTGIVYVVLLFATDDWRRLVPTSWDIFARTWEALITYLQFRIPEASAYNGLQQITYFAVVFLLAPFMLASGAAMSPALAARFPRYLSLFGGRQKARSLHFLGLVAFALFTIVHTVMVVAHGVPKELSEIVLGGKSNHLTLAVTVGITGLVIVALLHILAPRVSLESPRTIQRLLGVPVDPIQRTLSHAASSRQHYAHADISPYFRVNGRPPREAAYGALVQNGFADWKLEVGGLVQTPLCLSLDDLKAMPHETTITNHNCIQGWSNIGEWTGVPMAHLLAQCGPLPSARYAVFYALDEKTPSEPGLGSARCYYEVVDLDVLRGPQVMLAWAMNGKPLAPEHGAPLRLRLEIQLGFKMVKYLRAIELVEDYRAVGAGLGGWREDMQQYSREPAV